MAGRKFLSLLAAAAVSLGVASVVLLAGAGSALACVVGPNDNGCVRSIYHVQRTDGSLAEWTGPGIGQVVRSVGGNGTAVVVVCETTGPTEDGLPYIVWDKLADGYYVYGYYLDTPGDGHTPALVGCAGPGRGRNPSPPPPPNKFNAAGAAAWARAHATDWPVFGNNGFFTDDCTDFVSRAMHIGGGMPERNVEGSNRTDDHNWWASASPSVKIHPDTSNSWSVTRDLLTFLRDAGLARQVTLQAARPGDLIFVNWGKGGEDLPTDQHDTTTQKGIDHVGMIVGNPRRRGGDAPWDVQLAQHSTNTIENLSDWKNKNPNLVYWIYSIYYH